MYIENFIYHNCSNLRYWSTDPTNTFHLCTTLVNVSVWPFSEYVSSPAFSITHSLPLSPPHAEGLVLLWSMISFSPWHLLISLRIIKGGEWWVGALQIWNLSFQFGSSQSENIFHTHLHPPMSWVCDLIQKQPGTEYRFLSDWLKKHNPLPSHLLLFCASICG